MIDFQYMFICNDMSFSTSALIYMKQTPIEYLILVSKLIVDCRFVNLKETLIHIRNISMH